MGIRPESVGGFLKKSRLAGFSASVGTDREGNRPFETYWKELILHDLKQAVADLETDQQAPDVVLSHYHSLAGYVVAHRWSRPRIALAVSPACIPSSSYPPWATILEAAWHGELPSWTTADCTAGWHRAVSWAKEHLDPTTNRVLRELEVPELVGGPFDLPLRAVATLVGAPSGLLSQPSDWAGHAHLIAYPYEDNVPTGAADPIGRLSGDRPVAVVTFGTAVQRGLGELYESAIDALCAIGMSVVVLGYEPANTRGGVVVSTNYYPMRSLAPRCSLIVHHGGPGTTEAAIQGGVPSVVIPQFLDQPLNAWLVHHDHRGVALHPGRASPASISEAAQRALQLDDRKAIRQRSDETPSSSSMVADFVEEAARAPACGVSPRRFTRADATVPSGHLAETNSAPLA